MIVVGAGVIGLTCALELAQHGHPVTVVAEHFPIGAIESDGISPAYASPWAGAHFRPFPSRTPEDAVHMRYTRATQRRLRRIAEAAESSVRFMEGVEWLEDPDEFYREVAPGYREEMANFAVRFAKDGALPQGVTMEARYETWVLNPPVYLQWLYRQCFALGVRFVCRKLASLDEAAAAAATAAGTAGGAGAAGAGATIINCCGNGMLVKDPQSYPIRGQTLLVRVPPECPLTQKTITHQSATGEWTFVIPRPLDGGIILGGTKQVGATHTAVRASDTAAIVLRGRRLFPELFSAGALDVRLVNVGLRPARHGGMRVEREGHVVHAYGAGGMGYELSWGVAEHVRRLAAPLPPLAPVDLLGSRSSLAKF